MPDTQPSVWNMVGQAVGGLTGASDIGQLLPQSVKQGLSNAEVASRGWTGTPEERKGAASMLPYFMIPGAAAGIVTRLGISNPAIIQTIQGAMTLGYHKAAQAAGAEGGNLSDFTWVDALMAASPYLEPAARAMVGKVLDKFHSMPAAEGTAGGAAVTPKSVPETPTSELPSGEWNVGETPNPFADTSELPTAQMTQPEIPVGSPSPVADQYLKSATDYARNRLIHRAADTVNADKIRGMNDEQVRQLYRQIEVEPYKDYLPGDSQAPTR